MFGAVYRLARRHERWLVRLAAGTALFAAGAVVMRLSGMATVSLALDPRSPIAADVAPHHVMALLVGLLSTMILVIGLLAFWAARSRRARFELMSSLIEVMPQGVAYFDADDRFVVGNAAYRQALADVAASARKGMTYREMLQDAAARGQVDEAVGREGAWVEERMAARAAAGSVRDQALSGGRVMRTETRATREGGTVSVFTDITGLVRQAEDLSQALEAAQAATRAKSAFLTNIGHELRTPLSGVVTVGELLAAEPLSSRQIELVHLMRSSGAALNRLIGDLLELAGGETGGVAVEDSVFDPRRVLHAIAGDHAEPARAKGLKFSLDVARDLPAELIGDGLRLHQVLDALVANAVKFTDAGRVAIAAEAAGETLRITVADTGVGVDAALSARLFGQFELGDDSLTRARGGSGLGLALARERARRMGGEITCESAPGAGSTFTLVLPLRRDGAAASVADPADEAGGGRVLVVDDNPTNRRVLGLILEGAGIEATYAENGEQAVQAWRNERFDAVLMDIQMPVMDGLAATEAIRGMERQSGRARTPIIVVSANALPEHRAASAAAGADAHVAKPVSAASLFAAFEQVAPQAVAA